MNGLFCPQCDRKFHLHGKLRLGARLSCTNCHSLFMVVGLNPPALEWVYEDVEERDHAEPEEKEVSYGKYKFFWD